MLSTCGVTLHSTYSDGRPEAALAAAPSVAGWLLHVTAVSLQGAASRSASSVRSSCEDEANIRRLASMIRHPAGIAGRPNRMSTRELAADLDTTFSAVSLP